MTRFAVDLGGTVLEIDRSSCCGGVFLDATEHGALVERTRILIGTTDSARRCPRCSGAFQAYVEDGIEIDTCTECQAVFLDASDLEESGIEVSALFGVGPEAAREIGPSTAMCPVHGKPMVKVAITFLDQIWEVERAPCGGVFLDGGELNPFAAAARSAHMTWADREFAEGRSVADPQAMRAAEKASALIRRTMEADAADRAAEKRRKIVGGVTSGAIIVGGILFHRRRRRDHD